MIRLIWAAKPIDGITPGDLAKWRDELGATRKGSTVLRNMGLLSGVFTWAMKERGWIKTNPLALVSKPKHGEGRERTLSDAEWLCLMEAASTSKATWLPAALTVLAQSAMRRGELFGLRRTDVDYEARTAHLSTSKNGAARRVPLCPVALAAMRSLDEQAAERGDDSLLPCGAVASISTRFHTTVSRAQAIYRAECAASGAVPVASFLVDVRLHDLRHQAVTKWATAGFSVSELSAVSGHKSLALLQRYTHISASGLASKMAKMAAREAT